MNKHSKSTELYSLVQEAIESLHSTRRRLSESVLDKNRIAVMTGRQLGIGVDGNLNMPDGKVSVPVMTLEPYAGKLITDIPFSQLKHMTSSRFIWHRPYKNLEKAVRYLVSAMEEKILGLEQDLQAKELAKKKEAALLGEINDDIRDDLRLIDNSIKALENFIDSVTRINTYYEQNDHLLTVEDRIESMEGSLAAEYTPEQIEVEITISELRGDLAGKLSKLKPNLGRILQDIQYTRESLFDENGNREALRKAALKSAEMYSQASASSPESNDDDLDLDF